LAISKQIIEKHRGKIWAKKIIKLVQALHLSSLLIKLYCCKNMMKKILIVDDEPNIVMKLEYTFKKQNFEVFIARDGSEALQILETIIPDLVLLDSMMPNIDGYQTLKYIKKNSKLVHTKVIFLTAKNKALDIEKGMELGVDKYLTKPFSIKKIVSEVNELVS